MICQCPTTLQTRHRPKKQKEMKRFCVDKNKCLCDVSTSKDFSKKTSQKSTILSDKPYILKKVKLENAAEKVAF